MTQVLVVFAATFISVFTLGLQSLNVNGRYYLAAACTSLFIGGGHLLLYRFMPSAAAPEILSYLVGGVTGITSSIWCHDRAKAWLQKRKDRRALAARCASSLIRTLDEHADVHNNCGEPRAPWR
jgi:ethanolamine transporter EutH